MLHRKQTIMESPTQVAGGPSDIAADMSEAVEPEGPAPEQNEGQADETEITVWLFQRGQKPAPLEPDGPADLKSYLSRDDTFLWVDIARFTDDAFREYASVFGFHPIGVKVALDPWQPPRLDVFKEHFFVCSTIAHVRPSERKINAQELNLFVGKNYVLSAHLKEMPFAEKIIARAQQNPDLIAGESSYLLYVILDELVENYESLILHLEDEIEKMEDRALSDDSDRFLSDLLDLRHYAFALGRLADQHRAVFMALLRPDFPFVSREDVIPYFRDLETHLARIVDLLMTLRELINGSFDLFVSQVSHRTNKVMKLLTMISTILLPTTVVLGLFGTNFTDVPMYGYPEFWLMIVSLIAIPAGSLLFFRSKHWL